MSTMGPTHAPGVRKRASKERRGPNAPRDAARLGFQRKREGFLGGRGSVFGQTPRSYDSRKTFLLRPDVIPRGAAFSGFRIRFRISGPRIGWKKITARRFCFGKRQTRRSETDITEEGSRTLAGSRNFLGILAVYSRTSRSGCLARRPAMCGGFA